ncbi:MAG: hypothetical protein INR69_05445 [Mucilaginibacter polytrichastri]|nr:hypothetical protein [Mucilaginibacter polytrichastri]
MKKWIRNAVFNCREATYIIEKKLEDSIGFRERLQLQIHFIRCEPCRLYRQQSGALDKLVTRVMDETRTAHAPEPDQKTIARLQYEIDRHLNPQ